jgi:ketosteroid isomerase-like protein
MQSGPEDPLAVIRRYYEAYENDDQAAIESVLHRDFTFSSPNDDNRIDTARFLARCWPNHKVIEKFHLLDVCADSDSALVRYKADVTGDDAGFQCVEHFEFADGLVSHIDVYFGRDPD